MHVDRGNVRVYFPRKHPTSLDLSCRATVTVKFRNAELDEELHLLKRNLEVTNKRYDKVNGTLNTERTGKLSQEVRGGE
jgi:hypothetical protein